VLPPAPLTATLQNHCTALARAAQAGHGDVVALLLSRGANPHLRASCDACGGGLYPLHFAAARGAAHVCRLLLAQPQAVVDLRDVVRAPRVELGGCARRGAARSDTPHGTAGRQHSTAPGLA
jgi:ankyrin repeat protein